MTSFVIVPSCGANMQLQKGEKYMFLETNKFKRMYAGTLRYAYLKVCIRYECIPYAFIYLHKVNEYLVQE